MYMYVYGINLSSFIFLQIQEIRLPQLWLEKGIKWQV